MTWLERCTELKQITLMQEQRINALKNSLDIMKKDLLVLEELTKLLDGLIEILEK